MRFECNSTEEYNRLHQAFNEQTNLEIRVVRLDVRFPGTVIFGELKLAEEIDYKDKQASEFTEKAFQTGKIHSGQWSWLEEYFLRDPQGAKKYIDNAPVIKSILEPEPLGSDW
jgi:hypothetical protein